MMRHQEHAASHGEPGLVVPSDRQRIPRAFDGLLRAIDTTEPNDGPPVRNGRSRWRNDPMSLDWLTGTAADDYVALQDGTLEAFAGLVRAPADAWQGALTAGCAEGTLCGLRLARTAVPGGIVLRSAMAHDWVADAVDILAMPSDVVDADRRGEMDYGSLAAKLNQHRHRRPVIVATAGTSATEAVDDVRRIAAVCEQLGICDRYIHVDAPLSGVGLSVAPPQTRPGFDLADGADSIAIAADTFLATLMPCAVLVVRSRPDSSGGEPGSRRGPAELSPSGSRHAALALLLWSQLARLGADGLRMQALRARRVAEYAHRQLTAVGWEAWRHDHALTVVLRTPPASVTCRWPLYPIGDGWSRLVATPSVTRAQIDMFIGGLVTATDSTRPAPRHPIPAIGF